MGYEIIHVNGHYAVYSNGKFICSADTKGEAEKEIEEIEKEMEECLICMK